MNESKAIFKVGDYVKKNPETWISNDFDSWGRGEGIGQIVESPIPTSEEEVDVRWPNGRCFEMISQLLRVEN
jgi:hypothetical protein